MAGVKWVRERAGGGDVREETKGQIYRATVRPLDLALGKIGATGKFRTEGWYDYSGCWLRLDGVGEWMQKDSEGAPAKTQGREDGSLYQVVTLEMVRGDQFLDTFEDRAN